MLLMALLDWQLLKKSNLVKLDTFFSAQWLRNTLAGLGVFTLIVEDFLKMRKIRF